MSATIEERLSRLEAEVARLARQVSSSAHQPIAPVIVSRSAPPAKTMTPAAPAPVALTRPTPPVLAPPSRRADWEELLGGRLLGLVGGVAVLIGLAFFVALAIDRGWIGVTERVVMAFAGSGLLTAAGVWLGERGRRSQASLATVGTGIAGLYLSLVAATAGYDLVPLAVAFPAALAIGSLATVVAVRWDSQSLAGLGILGALAAPILAGESAAGATIPYLLVALAAAAGILVWRRWEWLRIAAFFVAVPQIVVWALDRFGWDVGSGPQGRLLLVLGLTMAIELVAALGFEVRAGRATLRASTALLLALNALVAAAVGGILLDSASDSGAWVAGVAAVHAGLGLAALRSRRVADEVGQLLLAVGLVAADTSFALLAGGPVLAVGWSASAVALALVARRLGAGETLVRIGLVGQLTLAAVHALLFDAPVQMLTDGGDLPGAAAAILAVAFGAFGCARLSRSEELETRIALDVVSLVSVAYLSALCLDGAQLVLAWAGEAAALAALGARLRDATARLGGVGFLVLAAAHLLVVEAPPSAVVYGVEDLGAAALGLVAVTGAALATWRAWPADERNRRLALLGSAALGGVYLASIAIVDAFQPGAGAASLGLDVDVRQQGQAILSTVWTLGGLAALAIGLRLQVREVRLAGFALLAVATGKVFLYDLSTLSSAWRVVSFVGLGLLLLVAAFVYQRTSRRTGRLDTA